MFYSVFPLLYFWFSILIFFLIFFLGETKKYGHYCLLWVLNSYDSAWNSQCLLNMLFKHYFGSYFGWNLSIRKTKIQLGRWQEIRTAFLLFGVVSCKIYWKIFAFCGLNGNRVYRWVFTASTVAYPHISIYVLPIELLAENHVYFALLCSL